MESPGFDYDMNSDEETEEVTETIPPRAAAAARNTGGESLGHIQEEAKVEEGYIDDTVARAAGQDSTGMGLYGELREAKAMQDRPVPVEFRRSHAIEVVTPPGSVQYGGAGGALTQDQHYSSTAGSDRVGSSIQSMPPAERTPDSTPLAVAEPYSDAAARHTDSSGGTPFVMHTTGTASPSATPTPQPPAPAPLPDYKVPPPNNRTRCYIILALVVLLIAVIAVAVAVPVAVTSSKRDIPIEPSPAPTESPTPAATVLPTSPPTPKPPALEPTVKMFQSSTELMDAVDEYLEDSSLQTAVAQEYGWPIGMWSVSQIAIFDDMFSAVRNPKAASFDESLQFWNVSRATSMRRMFRSAASFNQDLSSWRINKVTEIQEMFKGAIRFNQNLCAWQSILTNGNVDVTDMFADTACEVQSDPELSTTDFPGGFVCAVCPTAPTASPTMTPTAAPTTPPPTLDICNQEVDDFVACAVRLPGNQGTECIECVSNAIPEDTDLCEVLEAALCAAIENCPCGDCNDEMAEVLYCADREGRQCGIDCELTKPTTAPTPSSTGVPPGLLLPGCAWQGDEKSGVCSDYCGVNASLSIAYNGSSYLCSIDGCAEDVFDCTFLYRNEPEKLCNSCIDNLYKYCFQLFGEKEEICLYPDFFQTSNSFANVSMTLFCEPNATALVDCGAELEGCQDAWTCDNSTIAWNCMNLFEETCAARTCQGACTSSRTNTTDPYAPWTPEKGKGFKCTTDSEKMMTCKDDHFLVKKDAEDNDIVRFSFALTCPINLPDGSPGCTCEIADCECPAGVADCACTKDTSCRTCSFTLANGTVRVAYDCSNALQGLSGGQCAGYDSSGACIVLDEAGCVWQTDGTSAFCENYCGANSDLNITYNGTSYLCSIAGCTEEPFDCTYLYMNDRDKLCNACIEDLYRFCFQFYGQNTSTCVYPDFFQTHNPFANLTLASTCPVPFTDLTACDPELEGCQSTTRCLDTSYVWDCSNLLEATCAIKECDGSCTSNVGSTRDPYAAYTPDPEKGFRCTTDADVLICKDEEFLAFSDELNNEIAIFSYAFTCPVNNNGYLGCSCEIAECHCPEGATDCACGILQDRCSCSFTGTYTVYVAYDCSNALRELPGDQCAGYDESGNCIQFGA